MLAVGVKSAGYVRMSIAMEFIVRRQARLPATSLSPKPEKLWSQEKQHPQPEPQEVKANNSLFSFCQPTTLLNPKIQRNNMANCWSLELMLLWHWAEEQFPPLVLIYSPKN